MIPDFAWISHVMPLNMKTTNIHIFKTRLAYVIQSMFNTTLMMFTDYQSYSSEQ